MARKVADNLQLLACHPGPSPDFRTLLDRLQQHWAQQEPADVEPLPPQALWHKAPGAVQ